MPQDRPQEKDILDHINYGLVHLDGLTWVCRMYMNGSADYSDRLEVRHRDHTKTLHFKSLGNGLVEAGIMAVRKFTSFLGVTLPISKAEMVPRDRLRGKDVGIEHLELDRFDVKRLCISSCAPFDEVQAAFVHSLKAANMGVAHFTYGEGKAQAKELILCVEVLTDHLIESVLKPKGAEIGNFRVWTGECDGG